MNIEKAKAKKEQIKQNEPELIMSSQINFAGYNPRKITAEARAKLEKNLKTLGLMGGIVWNSTTGNLVSGHQRVGIMDKQNGYKPDNPDTDYEIWVTKVALTEKQEKEQNIFFNNQSAMGFFDDDKLKEMMKDIDFSEMTGFSKKNQISLFADTELTDEEYTKIAEEVIETTKSIQSMHENSVNETNNNYVVLVFKNAGEKQTLIDNLGIELDDGRFINGNDFLQQMYEARGDDE